MEELSSLLTQHIRRYPAATVQDMLKLVYQNEFGPSHFNPGEHLSQPGFSAYSLWQGHPALAMLEKEAATLVPGTAAEDFEPVGNSLVRCALNGPRPFALPTLCGMFSATAAEKQGTPQGFISKAEAFANMCRRGELPLPASQGEALTKQIAESGFAPVSHSVAYAAAYHPHYRLVHRHWQQYSPVFYAIDALLSHRESVTVAIDGCSGSGKSHLANLLQQVYSCNVFHMDDFFLPPSRKTPQRLAQPGGNVDYERFAQQVMGPLNRGEAFSYGVYHCQTGQVSPSSPVPRRQLNIVEGVYSLHPALAQSYDLKIFLTVPRPVQHRRILQRSGAFLFQRFVDQWIPLEDIYFSQLDIAGQCALVLNTNWQ